ncbi:MAG: hypothetical protein DWQ05_13125 [Calditrichaeota bacterium]|nr:MAG: hypothetical protein DWQ05_13125 [Calditrichota bacterium]
MNGGKVSSPAKDCHEGRLEKMRKSKGAIIPKQISNWHQQHHLSRGFVPANISEKTKNSLSPFSSPFYLPVDKNVMFLQLF